MNTYDVIDMPPMITARQFASIEIINDSMYVFGGLPEKTRAMEKYDSNTPIYYCDVNHFY